MTKRLTPLALIAMMLLSGCAGMRARAGSVNLHAGIPVAVTGNVDPAAGTGETVATDTETGTELLAFGFRINMPAIVAATMRAIRNVVPELTTMVLGADAAPVATPGS